MSIDMDLRTAPPRRSAGTAVLEAPRPDGPPPGSSVRSTPRRPSAPRRLAAGVLVGALIMFGVALLDTATGAQVPVLGSFAALPAAVGQPLAVAPPPAFPGTCLSWAQADAWDARAVDCGQPHLFEQAATVQLTGESDLPDDGRWRQLVRERCDAVVRDYLDGRFDPEGRYRVGALKPSPRKWSQGDRELRCGLQSASRSGALYPLTGRAAEQDQSAVHEPGTCLAIDGRAIGDPVDCGRPHAVEAVGVVDLGPKFPDTFPDVAAQDDFLQGECSRTATAYAGGDDVLTRTELTVYWDNLAEDSWKAGTRRVNCNLAALLPDRSGFAPVTGTVRGPVTVSDTPAPPASDTPTPGVPAQVPPVAPAPAPAQLVPPQPVPTRAIPPRTDEPPLDGPAPTPAPAPAPDSATPAPSPAPSGEPTASAVPSATGSTEPSEEPEEPGSPASFAPAEPHLGTFGGY
jgi:hypothetical protein